jgi:hypothetical protein
VSFGLKVNFRSPIAIISIRCRYLRFDSGGKFASHNFVDVAPDPRFAGLNRAHDGVLGVMEMFRCMLVLGRIATGGVSANEAHAEVDPAIARFYAVLTNVLVGFFYFDLVEVSTPLRHCSSYIRSIEYWFNGTA